MRPRRLVYRVKPPLGGARYGWRVVTPAGAVQTFATKRLAVSYGRRWARNLFEIDERLAQLVVHKRDGKIDFEHTYGADPERRVG